MAQSTRRTIHVYLPREAVDAWAPVTAELVQGDVYRIVDCGGEDDAVKFGKGALVRCRWQEMSSEPGRPDNKAFVAYEAVEPGTLSDA